MNFPSVWAEINLKNISHNISELKRIISPNAMLMAVVKANAYGHGAVEISEQALKSGANSLGVARLDEALQLRKAGFEAPILIFGYTHPCMATKLVEFNLSQTVYSYEMAKTLSDAANLCDNDKKIKVHIKIDTGMGRVGILQNAVQETQFIARLPRIEIEGAFMHFASADDTNKYFAKIQFSIFLDFLDKLRTIGVEIPLRHAANSAAIIDMPETHLDMVRAGISIYGLYASNKVNKNKVALKPAMQLKSRIIHLKRTPANFKISYDSTYKTTKPTTIATVSIGYADGLNRLLSSLGYMLVHGQKSPIVGRVCMDMTMLDVGNIPNVKIGDEAMIFGSQGNSSISVDEIAKTIDTINYEIVSTISDRAPRIYL